MADAYREGRIVRVSAVFIFNSAGELLIQKRGPHMQTLPGRWDRSAAGHVDAGETYEAAAYRELKEEIGITDVRLAEVGKFYIEETDISPAHRDFCMLYTATYDGPIHIDNQEVAETSWTALKALKERMCEHPDDFPLAFVRCLAFYEEVAA